MKAKKLRKTSSDYEIKDHQLYFSRLSVLRQLFGENEVSKKKRGMRFKIFFFATVTQIFMWLQRIIYARRIKKIDFETHPPIFILGHWRSGTTHLHYLMAQDPRLGFASNFNGFMISIGLLGRGWIDRVLQNFMPDKRPMDNVSQTLFSPSEEEQSVGNLSIAAGVHSLFFPKNLSYFRRFVSFVQASEVDKKMWREAYDYTLRVISVSNKGKALVLKNPFNTARPKELQELYPKAKFIFIHRNPYEVYRSTRKLHKKSTESQYLQDMSEEDINNLIFANYTELLRSYIAKRKELTPGSLVEIGYDELNADAEGTIKKIYDNLQLPGFEEALPMLRRYLESVDNYERNAFKPLPAELVERIRQEWAFSFEEWGYNPIHSEATMKSNKNN